MGLPPNLPTPNGAPETVSEPEYYVLGGGRVGEAIAKRLNSTGYATAIVDESYDSAEFPGHQGDPGDVQTLKDAGLSDEATVIVATRSDRRNLLIAQLVQVHFDVSRVLVLVNTPDKYDLLMEAGHDPVCVTTVLCETLVEDL